MGKNQAAWLTGAGAYPFAVKDGPRPTPGPSEIVIKNAAVAINPVDWKIQTHGRYLSTYPFILGEDAVGVVEAVGSGVTRFTKGQRVVAHCHGLMTGNPSNSGFQLYPVVTEALAAAIPENLSFEQAVVLPLAISTACAGLYQKEYLNLPLPSANKAEPTGQTVLIWGGASSVGATAIQLAAASGLTVVTTASTGNHGFVKSLGADIVFDYRSSTVVQDIATALRGTKFVGIYDSIAEEKSFAALADLVETLNISIPVASVLPYDKPTATFAPKYVLAYAIIQEPNHHVGEWIWGKFVPEALANGRLQAKPDPFVVGTGLKDIQNALDIQKRGVSAKKVVVTL
ncbi:chaperonin 10-like protein [Penicillium subrubescens]|uniref:chaperonin 10-like protein n=1 Tax=Penicillium subrubescens TaxID=1316194 RepID=UPI002544EC12|nr:chaperonin 10-like protein [Penicillium subrubescens]KAJ5880495.1 chaperonin 10-like protein [Penicillium subrubescens]